VDWNAGIRGELERLFGAADAPRLLERYHWLEPEIESAGSMLSYREVMARVLEELGASPGERDALARSLPGWPVFPEVAGALGEAGRRGWRLCILSNADRDLIDASMRAIGI